MLARPALLLLLLLPAACASRHELAKCGGPATPINTRWQPSPAQQAEMDRLVKEACR